MELLEDYGVSTIFNVADLSPFFEDEPLDLRSSPLQPGENDENGHEVHDLHGLHGLHGRDPNHVFHVSQSELKAIGINY